MTSFDSHLQQTYMAIAIIRCNISLLIFCRRGASSISRRPRAMVTPTMMVEFGGESRVRACSGSGSCVPVAVSRVPDVEGAEMDRFREDAFRSYGVAEARRSGGGGSGVAIVWFRNDLRVLDNEALFRGWSSSAAVLPVYCVDPRLFGTTYWFKFAKTGALRGQFLIESLADLKENLKRRGLDLLIRHGKAEDVLPSLAEAYGAHTKETCKEELEVERQVAIRLRQVNIKALEGQQRKQKQGISTNLQLLWGSTMYHIDDLPFDMLNLPDVYTQYLKMAQKICSGDGTKTKCCLNVEEMVALGYPLIDANMKELSTTGFVSNRGWQTVCSFLVWDMGIDWRMRTEWFETCLLDYDPCSNYGNLRSRSS